MSSIASTVDRNNPEIPRESGSPPSPKQGHSLKRRTLTSGGWVAAQFFGSQAMRFVSNVVLTYLLVPEAFGLMMLVNVFIMGLQMFSDVGIGPGIIQSRHGDDPSYLNTAWTVQVIRGVGLWICSFLIAFPAAILWEEPDLVMVLPVTGVTAVLAGFNSTKLFGMNRDLNLKPVVVLKLAVQVVSAGVMIGWALVDPSVWALVAGSVMSALVMTVGSHLALPGQPNRFEWHREHLGEMLRFGRWIFLSTLLTFIAGRIDQLMMPKLLGFELFGVFSIAYALASVPPMLMRQLTGTVGFPALADLFRRDFERFRSRLRYTRIVLCGVMTLTLVAIVVAAPVAVPWIYPREFHAAGWMLQLLAINAIVGTLNTTYGMAFMSMGRTFWVMLTVTFQLIAVLAATLTGYTLAGAAGFLVGLAVVQYLIYPGIALLAGRARLFDPLVDLPVLAVGLATGGAVAWAYLG